VVLFKNSQTKLDINDIILSRI